MHSRHMWHVYFARNIMKEIVYVSLSINITKTTISSHKNFNFPSQSNPLNPTPEFEPRGRKFAIKLALGGMLIDCLLAHRMNRSI